MKLLDKNLKKGIVQVIVDTADDLWYLHTLIDPGDRATGESEYKFKLGSNTEKAKLVRKKVWVTLDVEKTEFSEHTGQLRISGLVVDGSEEVPRNSHHGFDVTEGSKLKIAKERWMDYHLDKLDQACKGSSLQTLLVLFDREHAIIARLRPNGYKIVLELKGKVAKKRAEVETKNFYKEIVDKLKEHTGRMKVQNVIAASPSFWKEYLQKELTPELKKKVIFTAVSSVNASAIAELLKRKELQQALQGERVAREEKMVEHILEMLSKDKLVYGPKDLQKAVGEGNLSELFVSEMMIMKARSTGKFTNLEALMKSASDLGAKIHLLSTKHAMEKVDGLGGVVGVARW